MTMAEFQQLRELYDPVMLIDTNIIITGIVTSTDEFGSSYRELFFQDGTGGMSIRIANNSYHTKYRIGQRIFVKTKGLYLGNYTNSAGTAFGFYQLCLLDNTGRMINLPAADENRHIFRDNVPDAPPAPKVIAMRNEIVRTDYHTLVKLVNCHFAEARDGTKYYEERLVVGGEASQPIRFNSGAGEIIARISPYSSFANDTLPSGALNVTGLLTMFGTTPQLIIRSINDVVHTDFLQGFDMSVDPFSQGWKNEQLVGESIWTYVSRGATRVPRVEIQASSGSETVCRLVSPKFNFTGDGDIVFSFSYRLDTGTSENIQVLYTIDGTNWNQLAFMPQIGIGGTALNLSKDIATNPNLQIAFQYKTTDVFPRLAIMNITFMR